MLCFILAMNAYATPVLLGGPRFQMMAPVVANEVLNQSNWPFGGALAFVLMLVTLALTAFANVVVARRYR
jgi:putative spermidine/putrescine transport system permease protein